MSWRYLANVTDFTNIGYYGPRFTRAKLKGDVATIGRAVGSDLLRSIMDAIGVVDHLDADWARMGDGNPAFRIPNLWLWHLARSRPTVPGHCNYEDDVQFSDCMFFSDYFHAYPNVFGCAGDARIPSSANHVPHDWPSGLELRWVNWGKVDASTWQAVSGGRCTDEGWDPNVTRNLCSR